MFIGIHILEPVIIWNLQMSARLPIFHTTAHLRPVVPKCFYIFFQQPQSHATARMIPGESRLDQESFSQG